ncbi:MAG: hypothetical protein KGL18_08650 [Burkholderiales bacterium]|nr:hypothetical protein [Burkholderiales bacterium]MDE1927317.1 hypothetical protein [Burkholderiales bacterium]MDE2158819.1 hypothetical protein [Burkholderiales bacterium]MDE2503027.1 hypothetical protein [Burkholderiales bacterium]
MKNPDGMALKPADQLKAVYAQLDPERETAVYCQSDLRALEADHERRAAPSSL